MSTARSDRMRETMNEMFALIKRTVKEEPLDSDGVPVRLRTMAETVYSPAIRFHVPGRGPQAFEGDLQDYYDYNALRVQKTKGSQRLDVQDILVGDRHAAALIRYTDERDGESFSWLRTNVFTFNESGDKITEVYTYEHDQYGVDAWFMESLASH